MQRFMVFIQRLLKKLAIVVSGFSSTFIAFISCGNNLPLSCGAKAWVKSSRYPLTCPSGSVRCALSLGFIQCTHSKVNGHEKTFKTDH